MGDLWLLLRNLEMSVEKQEAVLADMSSDEVNFLIASLKAYEEESRFRKSIKAMRDSVRKNNEEENDGPGESDRASE